MGLPQNPSPPHQYPQEVQLKLYQAFIFSIPVLFSIILFLLFYLFYLKKRVSGLSSPPPILPRTLNQATSFAPLTFGAEVKHKLPVVLVDEDLRANDSQCSVCLGEFEMQEELRQVPSCKHVFHVECISLWLQLSNNSTCPLCRCFIDVPAAKLDNPEPELEPANIGAESQRQDHLQRLPPEQQQ
ncbi:probable E3 ubiquitin-protein ligase RHA4A [Diospyros lotus]|uniref:probable E3 ubiquitin-protein ligase RHA4A n=1 Tax=Diospyros lotus TaxID=55363 RepID=UPI00224F8C7C|nr:probable E3 ubiquitin-protein ligase RHA4A [Diospyros lotus]